MKKIILTTSFVFILLIVVLILIYHNAPVMKVTHSGAADVDIINFDFNNLRDPYEILCETGDVNLDFCCFTIEPAKKFEAIIIINKSVDGKILIYTKSIKTGTKVFTLPNPGRPQKKGIASWGRVYYQAWDNEQNQTGMKYLQIIVRKMKRG